MIKKLYVCPVSRFILREPKLVIRMLIIVMLECNILRMCPDVYLFHPILLPPPPTQKNGEILQEMAINVSRNDFRCVLQVIFSNFGCFKA